MADKEIAITYEALFELLRRERDRAEIQKLSETFYDDVLHYLKEKIDVVNKLKSETETEKIKKQIENIKRMLIELHERREKKIIDMAINKSRIGKDTINISILLDNEKAFFERIVALLHENRKGVLENVLATDISKEEFSIPKEEIKIPEIVEKEELVKKDIKKVEFLHPVPSFIGKNLESYGPFDEKETAELPIEIANVLITKARAVEVNK